MISWHSIPYAQTMYNPTIGCCPSISANCASSMRGQSDMAGDPRYQRFEKIVAHMNVAVNRVEHPMDKSFRY
jgi:hypothetical protein